MNKKLILIGGGDYRKNENIKVDDYISKMLEKKDQILIIPFAVKESDRRENRIESIKEVFKKRGFVNFETIDERKDSLEAMKEKIKNSSAIFLTGGDPKLLAETLNKNDLMKSLNIFHGVIIGYSAGAMIFRNPIKIILGIDKEYKNTESVNLGLDLLNFVISPHYKNDQDKILLEESKTYPILAIADKSAVIFKNGKLSIIGEVFSFDNMKKSKLNSFEEQ
jgi:peptidase E